MNWDRLLFWRKPPIADPKALADFIDLQSAFLVQKGLHDYARARSGHYAKVLFSEDWFIQALERSRWNAYPLGLAMVGEVVEGLLRRHAAAPSQQLEGLTSLVLSVFDRYPRPEVLEQGEWNEARLELGQRLQLIGLHAAKRVVDIPEPYARQYWDLMPIHKSIRSRDFPTTHSYLKVVLCNIHDALERRMDAPALAEQLMQLPSARNHASGG
jgi:hypothetical protein